MNFSLGDQHTEAKITALSLSLMSFVEYRILTDDPVVIKLGLNLSKAAVSKCFYEDCRMTHSLFILRL